MTWAEPSNYLPRGNGETVLVLDNEKTLVSLAEETLAELGYEPPGSSSSIAALGAFRDSPQRFDIVLTDEWMPELIDTDLAHGIAGLPPDLPIILMSVSAAHLHERACAVGIREILRKPLRRHDIAECFDRVLRERHRSATSCWDVPRSGAVRRRWRERVWLSESDALKLTGRMSRPNRRTDCLLF